MRKRKSPRNFAKLGRGICCALALTVALILSLVPLLLFSSQPTVSAQESYPILIERGPNFQRWDLGGGKYAWESAPQWAHNGSEWDPYIYKDRYATNGYYQVQNGLIGVRIYDHYAKFYTPDMLEVRVYDERWEVQRYTNKWNDIGAQSGTPSYVVVEDGKNITITKTFTSWAGTLKINYIFREGSALKHEVIWTSTIAESTAFRVVQKWTGIVGSKVGHSNGESVITGATTIDSPVFEFRDGNGKMTVLESQHSMFYDANGSKLTEHNLKPVLVNTHTRGMKADFVFGNWTLTQNETLAIDPATATLSDPAEDGMIKYEDGPTYSRWKTGMGINMGGWSYEGEWQCDYRGYVEWNITSLFGGTLTANPIFKYHGWIDAMAGKEINPITEEQPSSGGCTDAELYGYIASGAAYVDPFTLEVGEDKNVDLGASAQSALQATINAEQSWFAIGLQNPDTEGTTEYSYGSIYSEDKAPTAVPKPTLYIEYTPPPSDPPNPPTSLLCEGQTNPTQITDTQPEFSAIGTDNEGDQMNYYALQVDDDSGFGSLIYNKTKTAITAFDNNTRCSDVSYENSDLARGTTYYWRIKFWDNVGTEGEWSTETATFKINQLPTIPTSFTDLGMNLTDHTPTITWTKGTDGDGDTVTTFIYLGTTSTPTEVDASTTGETDDLGENASHSTYPLADGGTYYYRLRSWDGYEWSTSYTTADQFRMNSKPTLPTGINNLSMNLTDHTPDKTFTKGTDADGDTVYTVAYLGTSASPTEEDVRGTGTSLTLGENTSHSCYPLADGQTYYVRLRSWDGYEWNDSYTSDDQFRMNTPPTLVTNWTDLGMSLLDHTPTVTWTEGTDAEGDTVTSYIYVGTTSTPTTEETHTTDETADLGSTVTLEDGVTYYYRFRSYDGYEYSGYTTADEFRMNAPPEIISVAVDNSLIDRDKDDAGSGADESTTITLRVRDNDGREEIVDAWIAVRDNKDVIRENENVFASATIVDENTLDFTLTVNPADSLPDNSLGYWDVWGYAIGIDSGVDSEWHPNKFTVGDMGTTITFTPSDPYYHWELRANGTVYRLDGGSASADNVWYIDEVENKIFTFTESNTWSTSDYTINSQPGENITIKVIIWDSPLDGIVYDNYTVLFENWMYQITVKWEENFLVVTDNIENMGIYLNFIYTDWETETVQLTENVENFTLSYEPLMVRFWDSKENYHRTYKTDRTKIDIYIVGPEDLVFLKQYHIKLDDPLLVWGPPDGSISIGKFDEDELVFITNSYWTAASDYSPWLVYGEIYYIRLISPTLGTLDYGIFDADLITSRIITPSLQAPAGDVADVLVIFEEIAWSVWCDNENGLNIKYLDNSGGTNWTLVTIYDENADNVWQENISGNSWQENWSGADENLFYFISLSIDHDVFKYPDSRLESSRVLIGALSGGIPQPPHESPGPFDILGDAPVPWGYLFIGGMLIFTLIAFGPRDSGVGIIMTGAVAMLLFVVGLAPYGWTFASLMIFVGVISMLVERRSDRT